MTNQQGAPEALRLAEILEGDYCPDWLYEQGVDEVAAELRRLHTYCMELESQVIADCMTHGTGAKVEALRAQPAGAATPAAPAFRGLARRKLDDLIASGYTVNGFAIEKQSEDAPLRRGFITDGGFVGWWRDGMHQPPAAVQEPVAWRYRCEGDPVKWYFSETPSLLGLYQPLYTHPSPQPAVTAGAVDALDADPLLWQQPASTCPPRQPSSPSATASAPHGRGQ